MNHLDEGTIHAWLDGALDSAQSADVAAHVSACAQCAEAVAEARGIMAAASGIMRALDDDRVNVIPKAPTIPGVTPLEARRPVRRMAPWVMGIAATLLVAVVWRAQPSRGGMRGAAVEMKEAVTLTAPSATGVADAPLPAPPPAVSATDLQSSARVSPTPASPSAGVARAGNAVRGGSGSARPVTDGARSEVAAADVGRVSGAAAAKTSASADPGTANLADQSSPRLRAVPTAADVSTEPVGRGTVLAMTDASIAGCYPAAPVAEQEMRASVGAAVSAQSERRSAQRAAPAPAAAPRADFAAPMRMLRVDTATNALARVVRLVPSDSVVGSWRVVGDSLRLELTGGRTVFVARAARMNCP